MAGDPKYTTSSVKHGGGMIMMWACMGVNGMSQLDFFLDDVTVDRISLMNAKVYGTILCSHSAQCCKINTTVLHSAGGLP